MLKHFYKAFLISVISGSLLSFNPSIALAQEGKAQTTTDNNGVITAKQTHKFDKISDSDMLASLAMLSAGFITARMAAVYNPPLAIDAMIAAAAGAAFIGGEILTNVKFKGTIKEMTIEVEKKNDGTVNEEQVKRLEDLKKSYEEAKKTTGTKKMLQLASAAGFAAAAATAGYLNYTEYAAINECQLLVAKLQGTSCSGQATTYAAKMESLNQMRKFPEPTKAKESKSTLKAMKATPAILCTPIAQEAAVVGPVIVSANASCRKAVVILEKNQVFTLLDIAKMVDNSNEAARQTIFKNHPHFKMTSVTETPKPFFLNKVLDLFISKADAGWLSLLGLGGGVAAAFAIGSYGIAKQVDLMIYVPFNRMLIFGALSGIALMASKSSDNTMKKLDENIKKIDEILANLNNMSKGVKAQNIAQQRIGTSTIGAGKTDGISFSTTNSVKTPCMTNNSSENCQALANKLSSMPGFANLPDSFKDIANQVVSVGDGVSGTTGISGSTLSTAESLGNKQSAIARLLKATQTKIKTASNGKLDPEKETEKFSKSMAATLKKSLEKTGYTATGLMASIGGTTIDSSAKATTDTKDLAKGKPVMANAIDLQSGAGADKDSEMLKLDFKEESPETGLSLGEVASSKAAPDYDMKSTEINGENGPTLFELISGRYFKSGYPKLLEEEPSKN